VGLARVRLLVSDFASRYRCYGELLGCEPQSGAAQGPYELVELPERLPLRR
jgi:hypothetical protein